MISYLSSSIKGSQLFMIISLIGTIVGFVLYEPSLTTFLLILLGYFLYCCLGIIITYHRKLTHDSYATNPLLTKIFSILGCFAGTGSPIAWVAIHINHHLKSDTINDPHSPRFKGLKIFNLDYANEIDRNTKWHMRGIVTNKFHQFLHRYYFAIMAFYDLLLYLIGGLYLVIFLHLVPALLTGLMNNLVNYVGHKSNCLGGYRSYNLNDDSSNNWILAIPSWGEAWHNNHHRFPKDYTFRKKWWELDISGLIIKVIKT